MKVNCTVESEKMWVYKDVPYVDIRLSLREAAMLRDFISGRFLPMPVSDGFIIADLGASLRDIINAIHDDQVSTMTAKEATPC